MRQQRTSEALPSSKSRSERERRDYTTKNQCTANSKPAVTASFNRSQRTSLLSVSALRSCQSCHHALLAFSCFNLQCSATQGERAAAATRWGFLLSAAPWVADCTANFEHQEFSVVQDQRKWMMLQGHSRTRLVGAGCLRGQKRKQIERDVLLLWRSGHGRLLKLQFRMARRKLISDSFREKGGTRTIANYAKALGFSWKILSKRRQNRKHRNEIGWRRGRNGESFEKQVFNA